MSDYTQIVFFGPKDALTIGNPLKLIKGVEVDAELDAIADAIATKADLSGDSISVADGTITNPGLAFASDANNGLYHVSADFLGVGTTRTIFGISATAPSYFGGTPGLIHQGSGNASFGFIGRFENTVNGASLALAANRNTTPGSFTIAQVDDSAGDLSFLFSDGVGWVAGARIMGKVDGTPGTNDMPGRLEFHTTADGAGSSAERARINSAGQLLVGATGAGVVQYGFTGDTNTGLRNPSADILDVYCGGNSRARFTANATVLSLASVDAVGDVFIGFYESNDFTSRKGYIGYGNSTDDIMTFVNEENSVIEFYVNSVRVAYFDNRANGSLLVLDDAGTPYRVGYRDVPQNSQSGNYTLVAQDAGKHILHPSGGGAGDTFTIPANSSVAYPLGTVLTFINRDSNNLSIAITTDTMILAGTTTTGTRTLAQNGVATAVKTESATWIISGSGLS